MEENIYLKAENIKKLIDNDERVILLNKLEKEMNENEEVMALAYKKDMAATEYGDALNHYSEDSEEVKKLLEKLHAAKLALDNHELVKKYMLAYKEVRDLYLEINRIIFGDFAANLCPKDK